MAYKLTTSKTWAETEADIHEQLSRWGAKTYSLTRPNYEKRTSRRYLETPKEALVTLRADWVSGRTLQLSYNKQARAVDNARVLFLAIEALRLNETRGIDDVMREAYLQLPGAPVERDPYEVLGVRSDAPIEVIEASYKALAKQRHPDTGGSGEAMLELNKAWARIQEERR